MACHFMCHSLAGEGDIGIIFRMVQCDKGVKRRIRICHLKMKSDFVGGQ